VCLCECNVHECNSRMLQNSVNDISQVNNLVICVCFAVSVEMEERKDYNS